VIGSQTPLRKISWKRTMQPRREGGGAGRIAVLSEQNCRPHRV
jgi:hypothetical protein